MEYVSMISAILAVIISATTVFNTFKKPYKDLEENTSLQRKIKHFLIEGKTINLGIGTLK